MTEKKAEKDSVESFLRWTFKGVLDAIAGFLIRLGLKPNTITLLGVLGNLVAAVLAARGSLTWGGVAALLTAPLDAIDGAMARQLNLPGSFGAFLDSVTDRYDELILLGGLLVYFTTAQAPRGIALTYLAAAGSVLVSYTRARAEALGFNGKAGILTRIERAVVMIGGLLLGYPLVSVGIIAVLANVTAVQRILFVYKQSRMIKS